MVSTNLNWSNNKNSLLTIVSSNKMIDEIYLLSEKLITPILDLNSLTWLFIINITALDNLQTFFNGTTHKNIISFVYQIMSTRYVIFLLNPITSWTACQVVMSHDEHDDGVASHSVYFRLTSNPCSWWWWFIRKLQGFSEVMPWVAVAVCAHSFINAIRRSCVQLPIVGKLACQAREHHEIITISDSSRFKLFNCLWSTMD